MLRLPGAWDDDTARRAAAGMPMEVAFARKPALAKDLIERVLDRGAPPAWVTSDEVYGADATLRTVIARRSAMSPGRSLWDRCADAGEAAGSNRRPSDFQSDQRMTESEGAGL